MISRAVIEKYGLDSQSLKKYFTAKVPEPNVARLKQLIADRIRDGRERALSEYRLWAAVDQAYDAPLYQTTPTLLRNIMDSCDSEKSVLESLRGWGLSEDKLLSKTDLGDGKTGWDFNVPLFYNVLVPLVKSYVTIRLSKIFNDRNLTPLFEFPPREFTAANRLLCSILTQVVESVSINFGYSDTLRNFIFNALMYSVSIKFPTEPWYKEKRLDDDDQVVIEREGVRYVIPHITRTYWDMTYPLDTLNTGLGCEYAGYWTILKWGEVALDANLWNKNSVPHGTNWLDPNALWYNYFKEVYPCTLEFPRPEARRKTDRENMAFRYTRTDYDCAFFLTYHFQKVVPKEWSLGDYPHPVWMRFTIGGDDTVMHAEVYPYHPLDYIGYDSDANRGRNSSLALEVIPFQDITGNVLTQFLQTIKRNLQNITFYDTDLVDPEQIKGINKKKNAQYGGLNFLGYSGIKVERQEKSANDMFKQINFQYADPMTSLQGLNTVVSMLERVLAMSAQEIGAAASHQQSKKEVEITSASTSNRLAYTASFVDIGVEAWKRHVAEAIITNMSGKEVLATIPTDIPNLEENLKAIGFEFVEAPQIGHPSAVVKGSIDHLHLVQFVARRSDSVRENDSAVAQLMLQTIQSIANNQLFVNLIDPTSLLELIEYAAKLGGADDDFKVRLNQQGAMANQLKQNEAEIVKQCMAAVEQEVVAPVAQKISQLQQQDAQNAQQMAQAISQLQQRLAQIQQMIGISPQLTPPTGQGQVQQAPQNVPTAPMAAPTASAPAQQAPAEPAQQAGPEAQTTTPNMLVPANPKHVAIAREFLKAARGNKKKARNAAARAGYRF